MRRACSLSPAPHTLLPQLSQLLPVAPSSGHVELWFRGGVICPHAVSCAGVTPMMGPTPEPLTSVLSVSALGRPSGPSHEPLFLQCGPGTASLIARFPSALTPR